MIGCEYASIFSGLGVLVDLIDTRDQLLSFLDDEISDALSYHLRNNNVLIRHNEEYERVEGLDNGVILHLKSARRSRRTRCSGATAGPATPTSSAWRTSASRSTAVARSRWTRTTALR